jgi:hypothetical protein
MKNKSTADVRDWALKVLAPNSLSLAFASSLLSPLSKASTLMKASAVVMLVLFTFLESADQTSKYLPFNFNKVS